MTAVQFHLATEEILKNYWRIKAANALYRSGNVVAQHLEYTGIPSVGTLLSTFKSESLTDATSALQRFIQNRLPRDLFLALIAEFEGRIGSRLIALGTSDDGTLGALQKRIENIVSLPASLIEEMDEIRIRRNVMIHHGDIANSAYVAAAVLVSTHSMSVVNSVAIGDNVSPTESYLTYAADVLVRYSNYVG